MSDIRRSQVVYIVSFLTLLQHVDWWWIRKCN